MGVGVSYERGTPVNPLANPTQVLVAKLLLLAGANHLSLDSANITPLAESSAFPVLPGSISFSLSFSLAVSLSLSLSISFSLYFFLLLSLCICLDIHVYLSRDQGLVAGGWDFKGCFCWPERTT